MWDKSTQFHNLFPYLKVYIHQAIMYLTGVNMNEAIRSCNYSKKL